MDGIKREYQELLSKANIAYITHAIQHGQHEIDNEDVLIDAEREMFKNLSDVSNSLPQDAGEKMMLDLVDYTNAIQNRYFMYGVAVGARLLTALTK